MKVVRSIVSTCLALGLLLCLTSSLGSVQWFVRADNPCGLPTRVLSPSNFKQFKSSPSPICIMFDQRNKTIFFPDTDVFTLFELSGSFIFPLNNSNVTSGTLDPALLIPSAPTVNCTVNGTQIPCSNDNFLFYQGSTKLTVQIADKISPAKSYSWYNTNFNQTYVLPFLTILIELDNGQVSSVKWDDGCYSCDDTECNEDQCGIDITTCIGQGFSCDLKIYVAWIGTDANGVFMTSAGKRLSAFRQFSARSAFLNAAKTAEENKPNFDNFPPLTDFQ